MAPEDTVAKPEAKKESKPTRYVILVAPPDEGWVEHARVAATSALAAIRASDPNDGCDYVAVPERSWQPVRAAHETKPIIRLKAV